MRLNPYTVDKESFGHLFELARHLSKSPLEPGLKDLVEIRASQVNGCAYCLDLHMTTARKHGVDQTKLDVLPGWRESPLFSAREKAALALTEEMVRIGDGGRVDGETWRTARSEFDDESLGSLLYAIVLINAWNMLNVTTEFPPGGPTT